MGMIANFDVGFGKFKQISIKWKHSLIETIIVLEFFFCFQYFNIIIFIKIDIVLHKYANYNSSSLVNSYEVSYKIYLFCR